MRFARLLLGNEWRIVRCMACVAAEPINSRSYFPRYPVPLAQIVDWSSLGDQSVPFIVDGMYVDEDGCMDVHGFRMWIWMYMMWMEWEMWLREEAALGAKTGGLHDADDVDDF